MRKKALFTLLILVTMGIALYFYPSIAKQIHLRKQQAKINAPLRQILQRTNLTPQERIYTRSTMAVNDAVYAFKATNTNGFDGIVYYTNTVSPEEILQVNRDSVAVHRYFLFYFGFHFDDFGFIDKTYSKLLMFHAYFTTYLNLGGDPNYLLHEVSKRYDQEEYYPILYYIMDGYAYTMTFGTQQHPFFPPILMDLIARFAEKGYTNWSAMPEYGPPVMQSIMAASLWAVQTIDIYDAEYYDPVQVELETNTLSNIFQKIETLLSYGIDINATNGFGRNPLGDMGNCRYKLDAQSNLLAQGAQGGAWIPFSQVPADSNGYEVALDKRENVQALIKFLMKQGATNLDIRTGWSECKIPYYPNDARLPH